MQDLLLEVQELQRKLDQGIKLIAKYGKEHAEAERDYRVEKGKWIMKLRSDGIQATLIPDVAKYKTADLMFKRDTAEVMYKTAFENVMAIKKQMTTVENQIEREWSNIK